MNLTARIICATIILTASAHCADPITTKPAFQVLQSEAGRYSFGQVSDWPADKYMLDTQTGRIWQMITYENGSKELRPVLYQNGEALSMTPREYTNLPPDKK